MPSLFIGKIGNKENIFEIHALTKSLPFREFKPSEIADSSLFQKILQGRFELLKSGRSIYCTAVNPDLKGETETNPHDLREGTVHIVSIDRNGEIHCALSVAVDIGNKENDSYIGLPLENRWKKNGYSEGASLDPFRKKYIRINYGEDRDVAPWEMAELYRHYKKFGKKESAVSRLGTYIGCYHLMYREAIKKSLVPTWIWVFDAIPQYFNLYRYAGAAALRDLTIQDYPQFVSPNLKQLKKENYNNIKHYKYKEKIVSREIDIPFIINNGVLQVKHKQVPFLDGIVDIKKIHRAIDVNPITLSPLKFEGFDLEDMIKLRLTLAILGQKRFERKKGLQKILIKRIEKFAFRKMKISKFEFGRIG